MIVAEEYCGKEMSGYKKERRKAKVSCDVQ